MVHSKIVISHGSGESSWRVPGKVKSFGEQRLRLDGMKRANSLNQIRGPISHTVLRLMQGKIPS